MSGAPHPASPAPVVTLRPPGLSGPLVISVPHAGRHYPDSIAANRAVSWDMLHDLEDRYADRLIGPAVAAGAVAIVATHARAWLDLNRDPADRDPAPASPQGRAGLGVVPVRLAARPLWRTAIDDAEIDARVAYGHTPYHAAIAGALCAAHRRYGYALLIDCHSMPPLVGGASRGARLVLGDRHGTSARPEIVEALLAAARGACLPVSRNAPYAGAYTLDRHGRPGRGVDAIQLELDRSLYLEPGLREPSAMLDWVAQMVARLCAAGVDALSNTVDRVAAE